MKTKMKRGHKLLVAFASGLAALRFFLAEGQAGPSSPLPAPPSAPDRGVTRQRRRSYALALGLFLCALLSKTVTCSLPAAMLLVLWWKQGRVTRRDLLALTPFFALGFLLALNTAWLERHHVGAEGSEWTLSLLDRFLVAGRALWFYTDKLLWPTKLTFIYPRWQVDSSAWWQVLFPLCAVSVIALLWQMRSRVGRGPLVAVLFFAGTLVPALGFFNVFPMRYSYVADHFQYLASIGLIALGVGSISTAYRLAGDKGERLLLGSGSALLVVLGILTWQQANVYRGRETLWRDVVRKNPACSMAWHNLGGLLNQQNRLREALALLQQGSLRFPRHFGIRNNLGTACFRHGLQLKERGEGEAARRWLLAAIQHFRRTTQLSTGHAPAYINLGSCYLELNDLKTAGEMYRKGLDIFPEFPEALCNYARLCRMQHRNREALDLYTKAARLNPDLPGVFLEIALLHQQLGALPEAATAWRQHADQVTRQEAPLANRVGALVGLAETIERTGRPQAAHAVWRQAADLAPRDQGIQAGVKRTAR